MLLFMAGATHRPIEAYRGSDWLSLALGGVFLAIAVLVSVAVGSQVGRRRGPVWGIGLTVLFWLVTPVAGLLLTGGFMTGSSLLAVAACAALSIGCCCVIVLRGGARVAAKGGDPAGSGAGDLAPCPGCGVRVNRRLQTCPLCGARLVP
jgi:hypothetical protein